MPRYQLWFKPSAERAFLALPKDVQRRLDKRLRLLEDNPRPPGVKVLTGEPGVLRLRVGDYRVLYETHDDDVTVLVLKIGHRREVDARQGPEEPRTTFRPSPAAQSSRPLGSVRTVHR